MPIRFSQALLVDVAAPDVPALEEALWTQSAGRCGICGNGMDRGGDELEVGRDPAAATGVLRLSHARCQNDVIVAGDVEALADAIADDPRAYLAARGWRKSRRRRPEPRTPLLRAGATRSWSWLVEGELPDGTGVALGCLMLSFAGEGGEGGEDEEGVFVEFDGNPTPWTVVVLDAAYPEIGFLTLTEHASDLDFLGGADWSRRRVALESADFQQRIRLALAVGGDELEVRARFTPTVQIALASRGIPFGDRLEADTGAVLAARGSETTLDDLPTLIDLLGDALWLRAVVVGDPPGRTPDREALRRLALGA